MLGGIGLVGMLLLVFIGFLWILMPFAVFGTKDLISKQVKEQERTNALLGQLLDTVRLIYKEQQKSNEDPGNSSSEPSVL